MGTLVLTGRETGRFLRMGRSKKLGGFGSGSSISVLAMRHYPNITIPLDPPLSELVRQLSFYHIMCSSRLLNRPYS